MFSERQKARTDEQTVTNKPSILESESSLKLGKQLNQSDNLKDSKDDKTNSQSEIKANSSAIDASESDGYSNNPLENDQIYGNLNNVPIPETFEYILTKYRLKNPGLLNFTTISNNYTETYTEPENTDNVMRSDLNDVTTTDVSSVRSNVDDALNAEIVNEELNGETENCLNKTLYQANGEDDSKFSSENRNSDDNNDGISTVVNQSKSELDNTNSKTSCLVGNAEDSISKESLRCEPPPMKRAKICSEALKLEPNLQIENSSTSGVPKRSLHNSLPENSAATSLSFQNRTETSLNRNENNEVNDAGIKLEIDDFKKPRKGRRRKRESLNPFVRSKTPSLVKQVFPLQPIVKTEKSSFIERRKPNQSLNRVIIDEETFENMLFAATPGTDSNATTSSNQVNRSTLQDLNHKNTSKNESSPGSSDVRSKNRTSAGYQNIFDMFSEGLDQSLNQETASSVVNAAKENSNVETSLMVNEIRFEDCEPEFINGTVFSNYLQNTLEIFDVNESRSSMMINEVSDHDIVQNVITDHTSNPHLLCNENLKDNDNSTDKWLDQPSREKSVQTTSKIRSSTKPSKKFKLLSRRKRKLQRLELRKIHLKNVKRWKKKPFYQNFILNLRSRENEVYRKRRKLACLRRRHIKGAPITFNYKDNLILGSVNRIRLPFQQIKLNNHNIYVKPSFYGVPLSCNMSDIIIDPLEFVCLEPSSDNYKLSAVRCTVYDWRMKRAISSPNYNPIVQFGRGSFVVQLCEDPSDAERIKSIEPTTNDTFLKVCCEVNWRNYKEILSRQLCILHNRLRLGHCGKYRHLVCENWVLQGFRVQADIIISPKFIREKNLVAKLPITLIKMTYINDPKDYSLPKSANDIMITLVEALKLDLLLTKTDLFPHIYIFNRYTGLNPYKREDKNDYLREMADIRRGVSKLLDEGNPCSTNQAIDNEAHREALKRAGRLSQQAVQAINRLDLTICCNQRLACRPVVVEEAFSREVINVVSWKEQKVTPQFQNKHISFNPSSYQSYVINNKGIMKSIKPNVPISSKYAKVNIPKTLKSVRRFLPSESEGYYDLTSDEVKFIRPQNRPTGIVIEAFSSSKASIPTKPLELFKPPPTTDETVSFGLNNRNICAVSKKIEVVKPLPKPLKPIRPKVPVALNLGKLKPVKVIKKIPNLKSVAIVSKPPTSVTAKLSKVVPKQILKVVPLKGFVSKQNHVIQKVIKTYSLQDLKLSAVSKKLTDYLKMTSDAGCLIPGSLDVKLGISQILVDNQLGLESYREMRLFLEKNKFPEIARDYFRSPLIQNSVLLNLKNTRKKKTYEIRESIFQVDTEPQFEDIKSCTDLDEVILRSEEFLREAIEKYKRKNGVEEDCEIDFNDHSVVEILSQENECLFKKKKQQGLGEVEEQNKKRAEQNRMNAEKTAFDNLSSVLVENKFLGLVNFAVKCMLKSYSGRLPLLGIMYSSILAIRDLHCIQGPLLLHKIIAEDENLRLRLKLKRLEEEVRRLKNKNKRSESASKEKDLTQKTKDQQMNNDGRSKSHEIKSEEEIVKVNDKISTVQLDLESKKESLESEQVETFEDILKRFKKGFSNNDSKKV